MHANVHRDYQLTNTLDVPEIAPLPTIRSERAATVAKWFGIDQQLQTVSKSPVHPSTSAHGATERGGNSLRNQTRNGGKKKVPKRATRIDAPGIDSREIDPREIHARRSDTPEIDPPDAPPARDDRAFLCSLLPGPNQITFLTGPSGAGKSSMLRALQSVAPQTRWLDLNEIALPDVPLVDCFDGAPLDQTLALLSQVGLAEAWSYLRTPAELSEGQRWRLKLALAMRKSGESDQPAQGSVSQGCSKHQREEAGASETAGAGPSTHLNLAHEQTLATNNAQMGCSKNSELMSDDARAPDEAGTGSPTHSTLASEDAPTTNNVEVGQAEDSPSPLVLMADEFAAVLDRVTAAIVARCLRRSVAASPGLCAIVATSHEDLTSALSPDIIVNCDFRWIEVWRKRA